MEEFRKEEIIITEDLPSIKRLNNKSKEPKPEDPRSSIAPKMVRLNQYTWKTQTHTETVRKAHEKRSH